MPRRESSLPDNIRHKRPCPRADGTEPAGTGVGERDRGADGSGLCDEYAAALRQIIAESGELERAAESGELERAADAIIWLSRKRPLTLMEPVYGKSAAWIRNHWQGRDGAPTIFKDGNGIDMFDVVDAREYLEGRARQTKEERSERVRAVRRSAHGTTGQRNGEHVRRPRPCTGS